MRTPPQASGTLLHRQQPSTVGTMANHGLFSREPLVCPEASRWLPANSTALPTKGPLQAMDASADQSLSFVLAATGSFRSAEQPCQRIIELRFPFEVRQMAYAFHPDKLGSF